MSPEPAPFIPPSSEEHSIPPAPWRLFGTRPFFKLWLAQVFSSLGDWVGFFAIFALPLRIGELARPALSRMRQGIPISVGIGTMYPYIARPMLVAKAEGIPTVEIGATQTDLSDVVDFRFRGSPSKVLAMIWDVYLQVGPRQTKI